MFDKIKKLTIGEQEYSFKMTNKTILKIDEKYGNYGTVLQGIMEGIQFYTNALKLISCSCIDKEYETINDKKIEKTKEFSVEELADLLTPQQLNCEIAGFATELYFDYMGIKDNKTDKETKKTKSKTEKN